MWNQQLSFDPKRCNQQGLAFATMYVFSIFVWSRLSLTPWIIYLGMPQKIHTRPCWMINHVITISHSQKIAAPFLESSGRLALYLHSTLPFGWRISPYAYHSTGLMTTTFFRSIGIPCLLVIDDRHSGQFQVRLDKGEYGLLKTNDAPDNTAASSEIFPVAFHLVPLGYFLGLLRSTLIPSKIVPYFELLVDSSREVWMPQPRVGELPSIHPSDKKSLTIGLERNYPRILQRRKLWWSI